MKYRIGALTTTRAVAALMVVIFHYGCNVFPFNLQEHFFRQGNIAVGYFFVLSGFVLYLSYADKGVTYKDFIVRRLARIWPLYVFAILLASVYPLYKYYIESLQPEPHFGMSLFLNITLLQAYIPGYALTVNSPGWSLSVEMFFYLLFPLLLYFGKKKAKVFLVVTIIVYILSQLAHIYLIKSLQPQYPSPQHDLVYYQPVFHLSQFMIGMCGAMFLKKEKLNHAGLLSLMYAVLVVVCINNAPAGISLHNGLLAPLFLMLILSIASLQQTVLTWRPLVFLGEISFGIYILQEPLHFYFMKWNMAWGHLQEAYAFYLYLCLLILLAIACYYVIELPLRRLITRQAL